MSRAIEEQWSEVIEQVRILKAYADGEEVQYLTSNTEWLCKNDAHFDFQHVKYRIKPAEPASTYVAEE